MPAATIPPHPVLPAVVATPLPPAPADPSADLASKIDPIFAQYAKPGAPGCAVGVYRAGEVLFARGYGLANREYGLPIEKDTVFDIASVAKQFTAAAVALLVQDGKLSLDDDVRKYVPELPVYGRPISLRDLLHHTSGLRDYGTLLGISGFRSGDVSDDEDALFAIVHQKGLNFPTGTEYSYSNTGYFLLSIVVRRVTGKSLAAFAKERLFDPLGMTSTFFLDDHARSVPRHATGYARDDEGFRISQASSDQVGDGALQTTIEDLARWDANFYDPKVGGPSLIEMLRTPGKLDDGEPLTYALGLYERTTDGVATEEHNGITEGFRAELMRFPTERLTVACLCNVSEAEPEELAGAVAKVLLPKLSGTRSLPHSSADVPVPTGSAPSPADLRWWACTSNLARSSCAVSR